MIDVRVRRAVSVLPLLVLAGAVALKLQAPSLYQALVREDGLIEYCQFALYLGAGVVAIMAGRRLGAAGLRFHCWLYWLLGVGLVLVGLEEISWGQRIFGIATPERVAELNLQNELTIHNLEPLMRYLHAAYICVGVYGGFAWLINSIWPPGEQSIRRFIVPDWYLASYFGFLLLVYGLIELAQRVGPSLFGYHLVIGNFIGFRDQEPAELALAAGMLIFVLVNLGRASRLSR